MMLKTLNSNFLDWEDTLSDEQWINVSKKNNKKTGCQCLIADADFFLASPFNQITMFTMTWIIALFYPVLSKLFLTLNLCWSYYYNYFMMLYIKLIIKLDIKRQIQPKSDCQKYNGTDINSHVCLKICILITLKFHIWYKETIRRSKQDTISLLSIYTKLPWITFSYQRTLFAFETADSTFYRKPSRKS